MQKHLQYLLSALLLLVMTGCGANNQASSSTVGKGAINASMTWAENATAKTVASLPLEVAKIRMTVSGANVPVVRNEIAVTGGTSTQGQISGIVPGKVSLVILALDSAGATVYEGAALNVTITAGQTSDVGTITMSRPLVKPADASCVGCHENTIDTTGQNLVADFKQSGHYANGSFMDANGVAAGCAGCHGSAHNIPNPYTAGRCFDCHQDKVNVHSNPSPNTGAAARPAMYVATNYQGQCNACHQPHDTTVGQAERKAWAKSAHGDVNGAAWATEDMQQPSQQACQRCHTATGFKMFVNSNFTTFPTASIASAEDQAREVLACDACHSDNNFTVRVPGAFTAQYKIGNTTTVTFPNAGESNLCIACHSARENGVDAVADFTNASFKNSHYLPAAAIMYMSSGFINFTSANATIGTTTYGKTLMPDNASVPGYGIAGGVTSTHRKLGTPAINGDSHNTAVFVAGKFDANGPCVTCHMNANGAPAGTRKAHGHTLAIDENAYNQVCTNCHGSENTVPLTGANFKAYFIEPQAEAFQNSLALAVKLLKDRWNIEYDANAYPYFFKGGLAHTSANAVKNWTNGTGNQALGKKLMGACFNIQLLTKDSAAYAHGRSYSRRLVYDTIDFLDDGMINLSVGVTAVNSGMKDANNNPLFTKGTNAYNSTGSAITTPYTGTSEAMLYLLGWNRTTGAWNNPERP
ncbi:hypothetical protein [Geobacter sp. SVR]|uniref:multiheme c-type cytochrome n=1 Tax=Geobacter sp. SVR TaxID=2495594 RepID=UPI00143EFDD0|nr:hypothetical protein [Geobacter sp. SVR]BCS52135.1 hypothetical protein GSVR_04430 [Geobacter sp. SVR]GCF86590.1 hypothetical protein GSbR_31900 [Geobacter sp. SVR]